MPGHRTGSGPVLLAFALSSFPQKVMLLASLEVSLLQQSFPRASSPNLEPEMSKPVPSHSPQSLQRLNWAKQGAELHRKPKRLPTASEEPRG